MEMTLEAFLREMHGERPAPPAPMPPLPPRDPLFDAAVRYGLCRQWRPTPGDTEPPF